MTAREMFESLGYKYGEESDERYNYKVIKYYETNTEFVFSINAREFAVSYCEEPKYTTVDEFKAILKQMEELGWIEEKPEIKQETNFEHYKDRILDCCIDNLAVVKGIPKSCSKIDCNDCDFLTIKKECCEIAKDWLKQPYKKLTYKLNKFEFDLIQTYRNCHESCKLSEFKQLIELKDKGYFKDIALDLKIHEVLDNYEVTK